MRACVALALCALGCEVGEPSPLELEAADCEERALLPLAGQPHLVALNAYYLHEQATRALRKGQGECPELEETLRKARALGVTTIRTWAFNDAPAKRGDSAIQIGKLEYDEVALRGLELVLARASAHGVRLILPLGNYWDDYGGARQYAAWAGLPDPKQGDARFFSERAIREHYAEHLRRLLARRSTIDGQSLGTHPAVLAWELLNEPRTEGPADAAALRAWIDELGAVVRAAAPGKLVGVGDEGLDAGLEGYDAGFWSVAAPSLFARAGAFRLAVASPVIDYGSIHFFPESWGIARELTPRAGAHWIREHMALARGAGKPLVLGELGLRNDGAFELEERRALYRGWLRCARSSGLAVAGIWMFANDARPDAWDRHTFHFLDGTAPDDARNRYADIIAAAAGAN